MNKAELINSMVDKTGLTKADAGRALDATIESISNSLKKGEEVSLVGFATFYVKKRAARKGRNPQTGEEIKIAAANVPSAKFSKTLKDLIN